MARKKLIRFWTAFFILASILIIAGYSIGELLGLNTRDDCVSEVTATYETADINNAEQDGTFYLK